MAEYGPGNPYIVESSEPLRDMLRKCRTAINNAPDDAFGYRSFYNYLTGEEEKYPIKDELVSNITRILGDENSFTTSKNNYIWKN